MSTRALQQAVFRQYATVPTAYNQDDYAFKHSTGGSHPLTKNKADSCRNSTHPGYSACRGNGATSQRKVPIRVYNGRTIGQQAAQTLAQTTIDTSNAPNFFDDVRQRQKVASQARSHHITRRMRTDVAHEIHRLEMQQRMNKDGLIPVNRRAMPVGTGQNLDQLFKKNPILRLSHADLARGNTRKITGNGTGPDFRPPVIRDSSHLGRYNRASEIDTRNEAAFLYDRSAQRGLDYTFQSRQNTSFGLPANAVWSRNISNYG